MSVKVRQYKRGGWEVDIRTRLADGTFLRERVRSWVETKNGALRWGQQREAFLIQNGGRPKEAKEVPTLLEFGPRYMEEYARANRHKPSTLAQKQGILEHHLYPRFGNRKLDDIGNSDVQRLKAALADRNPKTVNNVLVVLNTLLKSAVEWGVISHLPATVRLLKTTSGSVSFYEQHEYEQLVRAAAALDPRIELMVLLGGEAGLRLGEIIGLEQTDLDFKRGILHVRRSEHEGHVTLPKSGRERQVNMTERLKCALLANRHLRGDRVLWRDDGFPKVSQVLLAKWMKRALRRAGMKVTNGGLHILRHTFCSRLAMLGAPTKAIQELAGHQSLTTTQRYMHLSPAAKESAIRLLDRAAEMETGLETAGDAVHNPSQNS